MTEEGLLSGWGCLNEKYINLRIFIYVEVIMSYSSIVDKDSTLKLQFQGKNWEVLFNELLLIPDNSTYIAPINTKNINTVEIFFNFINKDAPYVSWDFQPTQHKLILMFEGWQNSIGEVLNTPRPLNLNINNKNISILFSNKWIAGLNQAHLMILGSEG